MRTRIFCISASQPNPTTVDPRREAGLPALSQPAGDGQQQGARPTTTAVSSNEDGVSLLSLEGSDCEPRSWPIMRVRRESIVGVSRSDAGDAECYFSEDMDRNVLEDVHVRAPPSREGSIK